MKKTNGLFFWFGNHLTSVLIVSLLLVLVLPYVLSLPAICRFFEIHEGHNVGDAIGGITAPIIGIVSILLLCITLMAQRDAEYRSALENRIFQLIGLHRKNVEDMHSEPRNLDGQDVFQLISDQIEQCIKDIIPFIEANAIESIISKDFYDSLIKNRPDIDVLSFIKMDLAYSVVYIGVRDENIETLKSLLAKRYVDSFLWQILSYLRIRPVQNYKEGWKEWGELQMQDVAEKIRIGAAIWEENPSPSATKDVLTKYPALSTGKQTKYYWGHEFRLGHYFRHLYASVEYIDSQSNLSEGEKYEYVRLLRTQLSNIEQILLMANSTSYMGGPWEFYRKDNDGKHFITTYKLIKNIHQREVFGINYRSFFPDIPFEF